MKYAIVEEKDSKSIVKFVNSVDEFKEAVKNRYPEAIVLENVTTDELEKQSQFDVGIYLLVSDNKIKLVDKSIYLSKGYLYNSECQKTTLISTCELVNCLVNIKRKTKLDYIKSNIKSFDLTRINDNSRISIIGGKGSGKSTIIANILNQHDNKFRSNTLIVSPCEKVTQYYRNKCPYAKVIYEMDDEIINDYLHNGRNGAIVFDDCIKITNYKVVMDAILNREICNKMIIVSYKDPFVIPPSTRRNLDYVFLVNQTLNKKILFKQFKDLFPTFGYFQNIFTSITKNFGCMVINRTSDEKELSDKIFKYQLRFV